MIPHPEGGFYRELYRSSSRVQPADDRPARAALTTIYFLLVGGEVSRWHRVASDEVWHYYEGDPLELLKSLREIEKTLGRTPDHPRNISRKIDIDLLYFGDIIMDSDELQLPHPRMHLRGFVLQPLADIRPDLILRGQSKTVRELLAQLSESTKVMRLTNNW